jgi:hypothetical protein
MSNNRDNYWDDEEDDVEDVQSFDTDTDLVKKLRKALKAEQRKNKEFETQLSELTKSQKERILKDVLTSRGVKPSIAKYVPNDLEASPEAINAWLDANAEDFNIEATTSKPAIPEEDLSNMKKMDKVTTGAEPSAASTTAEQLIANATSEEEILSILSGL